MFLTRPTLRAPRRTLFPSSPAQPSVFFHPPQPLTASQSITRDARFSQAHPPSPAPFFSTLSQRRALCPGEHRPYKMVLPS